MELANSTCYAYGISTTFVYIVLSIVIICGGVYLYKKSKNKK